MNHRLSDLSPLLKEEPISYYWLGFLIADAHFNNNRIIFCLSEKDKAQVEKFALFVNYHGAIKRSEGNYKIAVMHTDVVYRLRNNFKISNNKTIFPCDISKIIDDTLLICFLIGFIDGDGCIAQQTKRNDCSIKIKLHKSWAENLQIMSNRVCGVVKIKPATVHINCYGYATLCFSNSILVKYLKSQYIEMRLPVLTRKWDKIDLDLPNRIEASKRNITSVEKMIPLYKNTEIASRLGLSNGAITLIIKRNNLIKKTLDGGRLVRGRFM
jgi:hypothetical protein